MEMYPLRHSRSLLQRAFSAQNRQISTFPFPETTACSLQLHDDWCGLTCLNGCSGSLLAWKSFSKLSKIIAVMHIMVIACLVPGARLCAVCKLLACGLTSLSGNRLITLRHCAAFLLCPGAQWISNRAHPARIAKLFTNFTKWDRLLLLMY